MLSRVFVIFKKKIRIRRKRRRAKPPHRTPPTASGGRGRETHRTAGRRSKASSLASVDGSILYNNYNNYRIINYNRVTAAASADGSTPAAIHPPTPPTLGRQAAAGGGGPAADKATKGCSYPLRASLLLSFAALLGIRASCSYQRGLLSLAWSSSSSSLS